MNWVCARAVRPDAAAVGRRPWRFWRRLPWRLVRFGGAVAALATGAGASLTSTGARSRRTGHHNERRETRLAAVLALVTENADRLRVALLAHLVSAHALSDHELADLLKPWLGQGAERLAIPMPAVIAVRLTDTAMTWNPCRAALPPPPPAPWSRITASGSGVWRCWRAACRPVPVWRLLLVTGVAAAVIAVATRAGLSTRREAIEIVHGLGATDRYIAGRFAARATCWPRQEQRRRACGLAGAVGPGANGGAIRRRSGTRRRNGARTR